MIQIKLFKWNVDDDDDGDDEKISIWISPTKTLATICHSCISYFYQWEGKERYPRHRRIPEFEIVICTISWKNVFEVDFDDQPLVQATTRPKHGKDRGIFARLGHQAINPQHFFVELVGLPGLALVERVSDVSSFSSALEIFDGYQNAPVITHVEKVVVLLDLPPSVAGVLRHKQPWVSLQTGTHHTRSHDDTGRRFRAHDRRSPRHWVQLAKFLTKMQRACLGPAEGMRHFWIVTRLGDSAPWHAMVVGDQGKQVLWADWVGFWRHLDLGSDVDSSKSLHFVQLGKCLVCHFTVEECSRKKVSYRYRNLKLLFRHFERIA